MDLSTELAQRCLQVKQAAVEDDPNREEFEDLAARERVARGQAARYKEIAHGRAREEAEKTPAETFTGRLYPIPHTLGEAAWRIPAMVGGGAMGYQAVARNELPDVESVDGQDAQRIFNILPCGTGFPVLSLMLLRYWPFWQDRYCNG